MHTVSQSKTEVISGVGPSSLIVNVVDPEVAMLKNNSIGARTRIFFRLNMWNEAQERLIGGRHDRSQNIVIIFPSDHATNVVNRRLDLGAEQCDPKCPCRIDFDADGSGFLLEQPLP